MLTTKWMLFDFGGCLDSDGIHSRVLFFEQFKKHGLLTSSEDLYHFQHAYSYSDRKVIEEGLIKDAGLFNMNLTMCSLIATQLLNDQIRHETHPSASQIVERIAQAITETQAYYLARNKRILFELQKKFHLGVISNFSGNLEKILEDFALADSFEFIIDSYHAGVEKPQPAIFSLALEKCGEAASNVCFVGDNPERDITPARRLGMKTVLISDKVVHTVADYNINCLTELLSLT